MSYLFKAGAAESGGTLTAAATTTNVHWVYLDAGRTHEVHAQVASAQGRLHLVTTEFPMGSQDPAEAVRTRAPVDGEPELVLLLRELEERLANAGTYFRTDAAASSWTPLARPERPLDLRAHEAPIPGMEATNGRMRLHHFHGEDGAKDRLVISMPRPGMTGRHILAEMSFDFPRADEGELRVLHARLATPLLASAIAKEHVEAPRRGFRKLIEPKDYERTYGDGWRDRTTRALRGAAARLVAGPAAPSPPSSALPRHAVPEGVSAIRAALAAAPVQVLVSRYVDPATAKSLVAGGEHTVRRFVAGLRRKLSHQHAYDLSVLEAALLCEYAIPAQMWDLVGEEGAKLVRFAAQSR